MDNSPEYVIANYAAWLAGGVAVGLNTAARSGELLRSLRHCEASVLVAAGSHRELPTIAAGMDAWHLVLTGRTDKPFDTKAAVHSLASLVRGTSTDLLPSIEPSAPASIVYTSGTTGESKGVTLSHANLSGNTRSIVEYLQLSNSDSIVNVLPFFYSYGSSVLHTHLSVGGTVIIENSLSYPHVVVERMASEKVTGFAGVSSTFALLLQRVKLAEYDLSSLRYVTQAGGPMRSEMIQRVRAEFSQAQIFVMYGQTEASARLTYLPPARLADKLGSVGIPVSGTEISVRIDSGEVAAPGVVGEVWVRGPSVMLGYWRDTEGSSSILHDGWLKTGDLGYLDTDGFLFLSGRRSDMIKVGAHRIHPKEIEDVIAGLPGVAEAAVVGMDDEILGQTILAVVVISAGATVQPVDVQACCREKLASYKVPKTVLIVDSLPKTASGKVRRAELARGVSS